MIEAASLTVQPFEDCNKKHKLLQIDHYLSSVSGNNEFPVYKEANPTSTIVKNINYAKKVSIEKFVNKDGNIWKFAKIQGGYLQLYNDDGNPVFRILGDSNHFGPWMSTWDEKYFKAIQKQNNNEEMLSVLTSDLIRFDDLVQSSDEESFMDDTILLTDDEESYMF